MNAFPIDTIDHARHALAMLWLRENAQIAEHVRAAVYKKWPQLKPRYLIWSEERGSWWKPGRRGYTRFIKEAGRYSQEEAREIVTDANKYPLNGMDWCEVAFEDPLGPGSSSCLINPVNDQRQAE